jgi:GT2 family glycosyltransferase
MPEHKDLDQSWGGSSTEAPRVAIVITARNRASELLVTLRKLKTQVYRNFTVIVVDDASEETLEGIVRSEWPQAVFIRNEVRQGLIANRSKAMKMADGEFIVSLDDDSCFTDPGDLEKAVARMLSEPQLGIVTFLVCQGTDLIPERETGVEERYVASFVGCAHMLRSSVVAQLGGYRDFYFYYAEESEYSLRVWDAGWRILFFPEVLVHHRISPIGRRDSAILRYSIRNNLWTTILHMPLPRVVLQVAWRLISYSFESLRLLRPGVFLAALGSVIWGLPTVLALRRPISADTLRILDVIATRAVRSGGELSSAPTPPLTTIVKDFYFRWKDRPRARSFWDRKPGDVGRTPTTVFKHNLLDRDSK